MKQHNTYQLFFIVFFACLLASCGSKKALYNPNEVAALSKKLGVEIRNNDENMPLYAEVSTWLGVRYKYAGLSRKGVDCSGFAHLIFRDVYGLYIPRSSGDLANSVKSVSKKNLRTGDLVFFATNSKNKNRINHVGIYLKDDKFIHASTSKGVIVNSLNDNYYQRTWKKGGRVDKSKK
jgi:lipoprotein Spr